MKNGWYAPNGLIGVSGGAPKKPISEFIFPARFKEQGSDALRWIFGIDRIRDSKDPRTCKGLFENFISKALDLPTTQIINLTIIPTATV